MLFYLAACTPDSVEPGPEDGTEGAEVADVLGLANWDDDDADGEVDWDDAFVDAATDDERVTVELNGATHLRLDGEYVRLRDGDTVLLDTSGEVDVAADVTSVQIEFGEANVRATLTVGDVETSLRSAPLVLNNHLQEAEWVGAMEMTGGRGNDAFVAGFTAVLGDRFDTFTLTQYDYDVWFQDEIELGTMTTPDQRMDVVIDSIRSKNGQGLDDLPEDHLLGPGVGVRTWGAGRAASQDSFGNLEVTPPITVDGVEYPFGRIYYGDWQGNGGPTEELRDELDAQALQKPFVLDVSWLCVGHVDEFMSFVPDSSAPKGWRLYLADTTMGLAFIDGIDAGYPLTRYGEDHGYDTVGDLQADEELRAYNEDIQRDGIDPALAILRVEAGVEDADIVRIPALFEASSYCAGDALSLIPGTNNLVVSDLGDGVTHIFTADPFFRTDPDDLSSDLFVAEVEPLFPQEAEVHWLDDWDWYHLAWGEVHCGSNTRRAPAADWWEVATHLLEAE